MRNLYMYYKRLKQAIIKKQSQPGIAAGGSRSTSANSAGSGTSAMSGQSGNSDNSGLVGLNANPSAEEIK